MEIKKDKKMVKSNNEDDLLRKDIVKTLSKITKYKEEDLTDDILIREEIGMDSLQAMEIVAKIEEKYNIRINEEKLFQLSTLGNFITLIKETKT